MLYFLRIWLYFFPLKEYKWPVVFCLLLVFSPSFASQQAELVLRKGVYKYAIARQVEILQDTRPLNSTPLQLEDVLQPTKQYYFSSSNQQQLDLGEGRSDYWLRVNIRNSADNDALRWLLEVPLLDSELEVYTIYPGPPVSDTVETASLPQAFYHAKAHPFTLYLQAGQQVTLYLHLRENLKDLNLWEEARYYQQLDLRDMLLSAYFSIFLVMMLYNLLLFVTIRDISYLYYVLYCLGFVFTQLFLTGFGLQYFWANHPWVEDYLFSSMGITGLFGALMVRSFLNVPKFLPRLDKLLLLNVLIFAYISLSVFWDYAFLDFKIIGIAAIVNSITLFVSALIIWRKGFRPARYYIVGFSLLLVSIIIYYLSALELIPVSFFTKQCVKFSFILETILLSLALADRINSTKKEKEEAQNRAIALLQESERIKDGANQALQKAYQELLLSKGESSKLQELDQLKTRFFANISHEFRTPLTLILGPLEQFLHNPSITEHSRQEVEMMYRSAQRLLRLINQLLDLSKLEAGQLKLVAAQGNFTEAVRSLTYTFSSLAESRHIDLNFHAPQAPIIAYFDYDKLEQVVGNLLSNAIKFTPDGGEVEVSIEELTDEVVLPQGLLAGTYAKLSVRDTGVGIPAGQLDKVFDRFYQVDGSHTRAHEGTGIGLALVKELIQLHKGHIQVESREGQGTTFTILLPAAKSSPEGLQPVQSGTVAEPLVPESLLTLPATEFYFPAETMLASLQEEEQPVLLIVDDSADIRKFIHNAFKQAFLVLEAKDGEEGHRIATQKVPDIIISDYMMPRMDGRELCEKLKADERTSHVPVILLTARANVESRLQGLETGADDYVVKPFNMQELHVRVRNLINSRHKLRGLFSRQLVLKPKEITVNSTDERFLNRLTDILEKNLADPDFSVEAFCKEAGMSRVNLHRKLKSLTDQSASEFIRLFRLKRAAQLLSRQSGGSAEVAYQVGFNNLSYFAKCFKEVHGKTPTEFAAESAMLAEEGQ